MRLQALSGLVAAGALLGLAACVHLGEVGIGTLSGRVLVEWDRQDKFIYRKTANALHFRPAFIDIEIVPGDMYTDGGSVPQILWGIPGLSPWALGPAYIIHDWIFLVHRCRLDAYPEVRDLSFEDSAKILAEVGRALIKAGLVKDDKLGAIVAAVETRFARSLWDRPGTPEECAPPPDLRIARARVARPQIVVDFTIPVED